MPICSNPDCLHDGENQPETEFQGGRRRCKTCRDAVWSAWYARNRERVLLKHKRIRDDDPEDDLRPIEFGTGSWNRLTR